MSSPNDPTLDSVPLAEHARVRRECQKVELVEGSSPHITGELMTLLRVRLRAAAIMMLIGFGAFFVWRLFWMELHTPNANFIFYLHCAVVATLSAATAVLYRCKSVEHWRLRCYEAMIFIPPVLLFIASQHDNMIYWANRGFLYNSVHHWLAIVFTYALFIPNTWRRAGAVLGFMSLAPSVITAALWESNPQVATLLNQQPDFFVEQSLLMTVCCISSVYGTHMINTLRLEAFEARQMGQYRLCRLIGSGGMGEVYLAEHQMMKRPCAIKVIRPGKAADPQALARFEREVQATARLSHWNTIEIFDYGRTDDGTFYYVMEFLPGLSLAELVDRHGALPPARVIHLLMQTCDALAEAHAVGLIHRDIKPGNIFAAKRGGHFDVAKLLDFGLAKAIVNAAPVQLTQEGSISGSPLYMSPEQAMGETEPDARSDIYSLGAVAYYLLTGAPPFDGDKAIKIIIAHANEEVVPPSHLRPDVPSDLEQIVLRCLAKEPDDRFPDAISLARALVHCADAGGWTREDAANWWRSSGAPEEKACQEVA